MALVHVHAPGFQVTVTPPESKKGTAREPWCLQKDSAQNFGIVPWRLVIPVGDLGHLARPLRPSFTAAGVRGLP